MSVDLLQEKIRKRKNPFIIDFTVGSESIPPYLLEQSGSFLDAYATFCRTLLEALKDTVPAVRFRFANFSLYGSAGLELLRQLLNEADGFGYYVLLDCVQVLSPDMAQMAADTLLNSADWKFNGLILSTYIGSDGVKPFINSFKDTEKALFCVVRTGNKSAAELQDLLTGNRLSHVAAADLVNRLGEAYPGRSGYHRIAAVAAASSGDSVRMLRTKYGRLFLLLDGFDYPGANAKNCSYAFDQFGHGCAVCVCDAVVAAWKETETQAENYAEVAVAAVDRLKKNVLRYVTIL